MYGDTDDPRDQEELDRRALLAQMNQTPEDEDEEPERDLGVVRDPVVPPGATKDDVLGTTPPSTSNVFQSNNPSVRGYIDAAVNSYAPTVQGIAGEAGRKAKIQEYLQGLVPEIQKRGGVVGDIKNEKIMIDGQWVDVLRDIEGAAAPQYLVESGDGGGGAFSSLPMPGLGEFGSAKTSLPTDAGTYQELMRRIQEILGPEAVDREALLRQMKA